MSYSGPRRSAPAILTGMLLLARGRPEGLQHFGNSTQAFLASLAPLIAFPFVGGLLLVLKGSAIAGLVSFLETMCVLLAQPVISEVLATWWGKGDLWLRYATALNWCQWLMPVLASALIVIVGFMLSLGMPPNWAVPLLLAGLGGYALWLQWFLARYGLLLSGSRAASLVVLVNLGTAALLLGPHLFTALG